MAKNTATGDPKPTETDQPRPELGEVEPAYHGNTKPVEPTAREPGALDEETQSDQAPFNKTYGAKRDD
jgi:hypothetical protein